MNDFNLIYPWFHVIWTYSCSGLGHTAIEFNFTAIKQVKEIQVNVKVRIFSGNPRLSFDEYCGRQHVTYQGDFLSVPRDVIDRYDMSSE